MCIGLYPLEKEVDEKPDNLVSFKLELFDNINI
jgi:hypothetical protein